MAGSHQVSSDICGPWLSKDSSLASAPMRLACTCQLFELLIVTSSWRVSAWMCATILKKVDAACQMTDAICHVWEHDRLSPSAHTCIAQFHAVVANHCSSAIAFSVPS